MKKALSILAIFSFIAFGTVHLVAQDTAAANQAAQTTGNTDTAEQAASTPVVDQTTNETATNEGDALASETEDQAFHQILKDKFIEGDPTFMTPVLITLILGLALCIERIIYLNMATPNTRKLLEEIETALNEGGVERAKEVCRNTRGPVASIFYQGLDRTDEGIDVVEKSIISYGSVQMGLLERNISWISLFIALAPMLGFMGTVIGMIGAFDAIEAAGDISPSLVAGGIKIALLTTVFGLIVAIILQIFYNYIVSRVDSIVNTMEDASISLIDILIRYQHKHNRA